MRSQVVKATGQRYLSGYSDDESQYRALLSSGKSFTERFNISPGADLSAELTASAVSNQGRDSSTRPFAGNDIILETA